jgi:hypothetical protein
MQADKGHLFDNDVPIIIIAKEKNNIQSVRKRQRIVAKKKTF